MGAAELANAYWAVASGLMSPPERGLDVLVAVRTGSHVDDRAAIGGVFVDLLLQGLNLAVGAHS